jgi:hypothetical protein
MQLISRWRKSNGRDARLIAGMNRRTRNETLTPFYLWRNTVGRCLALDYPEVGNSGAAPNSVYRFISHQRYLDACFAKLEMEASAQAIGSAIATFVAKVLAGWTE